MNKRDAVPAKIPEAEMKQLAFKNLNTKKDY